MNKTTFVRTDVCACHHLRYGRAPAELSGALTEAMTAVASLRPQDPLGLLAAVLYRRAAQREYGAVQEAGPTVPLKAERWMKQPGSLDVETLSEAPTAGAGEELSVPAAATDLATLLRRVSSPASSRQRDGHASSRTRY